MSRKRFPPEQIIGKLREAEVALADAILDRLVHNAYKINLKGESMRRWYAKKDDPHMMGE